MERAWRSQTVPPGPPDTVGSLLLLLDETYRSGAHLVLLARSSAPAMRRKRRDGPLRMRIILICPYTKPLILKASPYFSVEQSAAVLTSSILLFMQQAGLFLLLLLLLGVRLPGRFTEDRDPPARTTTRVLD